MDKFVIKKPFGTETEIFHSVETESSVVEDFEEDNANINSGNSRQDTEVIE